MCEKVSGPRHSANYRHGKNCWAGTHILHRVDAEANGIPRSCDSTASCDILLIPETQFLLPGSGVSGVPAHVWLGPLLWACSSLSSVHGAVTAHPRTQKCCYLLVTPPLHSCNPNIKDKSPLYPPPQPRHRRGPQAE